MTKAPLTENELDRLRALVQCRILDTPPDVIFDDIARLAAQICNTPFAFVGLMDAERQWFKAKVGLDTSEISRDVAFCNYTILQSSSLIVPDTLLDERFKDNPYVLGEPHIRFYAGVPLITSEGYGLGTVCVVDQTPRELSDQQIQGLEALGRQVTQQLELRRSLSAVEQTIFERQAISPQPGQVGRSRGFLLGGLLATLLSIGVYAQITTNRLQSEGVQAIWEAVFMPLARGLSQVQLPGLSQLGLAIAPLLFYALYHATWQQRQIKKVLKTERNFTRALLDTVGALVVVLDTQGRIVRFNRTCEQITGYSFEEVRHRYVWDVFLPIDEREAAKAQFADGQTQRFPRVCEGSWLTKSGQKHPIAWSQTALFDQSGSVQYVINTGLDLSDRKQAQAAQSQLAAIVESSNDAIIGITLDGKIQTWNAAAERMYGYSPNEVQGKPVIFLAQPMTLEEDLASSQQSLAQFLEPNQTQHVRKDGKRMDVALTLSPIREIDGSVTGTSIIARDITALMAIERMKDEFIAVVSHELRTPLASLKGALELLLTGKLGNLSEKGQRMLKIALVNSNRLNFSINNILNVDPKNYQLSKRLCDVADIIQSALKSVRAIADETGTVISATVISAQVYADPERLAHVFEQLLHNAIKFSSKPGEVVITVEQLVDTSVEIDVNHALTTQNQILIRVQDRGIGIPADKLEIIFERFYQIDASNSRPKGGTGLGLAICRNLIEQHQGRIWAKSCLGEGSTFHIVLPCIIGQTDNKTTIG
ncbi:MAG: PAS domain S-box protein [Oculatellaceae cyanobacterium bins.114]|nr:PAS domain S-box protein [Oculatellaceae cyanobacterium bins.114]